VTKDLATLPKAHLHLHLEAAMRPATLHELAEQHGVTIPQLGFRTFSDFIVLYEIATDVLRTEDDLARLLRELAEDAANDGATWVEYFVYPPLWLGRFGDDDAALELVLSLARAAGDAVGIGLGAIVTADRTDDPKVAEHWAAIAARHAGADLVGFGLANDETHFPPEPFERAFTIARDGGLLSVPHAGELAGPESVRAALDVLHADRIGHGVRAVEDHALVTRLADEQIPCDVCPTSNLVLDLYPSMKDHAIRTLIEAGVPVTVNTDDPLLFGPGLAEEYTLVRDAFGYTDDRMAAIAQTSIVTSGAPQPIKDASLAAIRDWLA
jgi:adenosine deaminase